MATGQKQQFLDFLDGKAPPLPGMSVSKSDFLNSLDGPSDDDGVLGTIGDVAMDLTASFGVGANALLGLGGTLYGLATGEMDNWATRQAEFGRKYWNDRKSDALVAAEERRAKLISEADGELDKAGVALWQTLKSPALLTNFLAEQVPMLIPGGAAGRAAGAGVKFAGGSAKAAQAAAAGTVYGTGSALQGGDSSGQAYEQLKNLPDVLWAQNPDVKLLTEDGMSFEDAVDQVALSLSRNTFAAASALSLATNLIPGARIIEQKLAGIKAPGGSKILNAAKGYVGETLQEGIEEGSAALFANLATGVVDPEQAALEGVGEATGMGMAAGPLGALAGAANDAPLNSEETAQSRSELHKRVSAELEAAGMIADEEIPLPLNQLDVKDNGDGTTTARVRLAEDQERVITTDDTAALEEWIQQVQDDIAAPAEPETVPPADADRPSFTNPLDVADVVMNAQGGVDDIIGATLGQLSQSGLIGSRLKQMQEKAAQDAQEATTARDGTAPILSLNELLVQAAQDNEARIASLPDEIEISPETEQPAPVAPPLKMVRNDDPVARAAAAADEARSDVTYFDPRLKRDEFRGELQRMRNDVTYKGGIGVIADENDPRGYAGGRTASVNPDWFQTLAATEGVTTVELKKMLDKALAGGRKLGAKEERIVTQLLDGVSIERTEPTSNEPSRLEQARAEREQRRFERREGIPPAAPFEVYEQLGERFEEETYEQIPDMSVEARMMYDLSEAVDELGGNADAILNSTGTDEERIDRLEAAYEGLANEQGNTTTERDRAGEEATAVDEIQQEETPATDVAAAAVETDLLGEVPVTAQGIADETRRKDAARNTGETDMTGTLFGQDRQQTDIDDAPAVTAEDIDARANEAATSDQNDLPEPTEAQKEAGNYKKGKAFTLSGLRIVVENPRGSKRKGTDPDGREWSNEMTAHYGDIKQTVGAEGNPGEGVDVFVGQSPGSKKVWIVDAIDQDTGAFDEHKVLMGFTDKESALDAYLGSYNAGSVNTPIEWEAGPVSEVTVDELKKWLDEGDQMVAFDPEFRAEQVVRAEREAELEAERANAPKPMTIEEQLAWLDSRDLDGQDLSMSSISRVAKMMDQWREAGLSDETIVGALEGRQVARKKGGSTSDGETISGVLRANDDPKVKDLFYVEASDENGGDVVFSPAWYFTNIPDTGNRAINEAYIEYRKREAGVWEESDAQATSINQASNEGEKINTGADVPVTPGEAGPARPAPAQEPDTDGRAAPGGEIGVNGYFYKGGQFLPSTMAEPGTYRITVNGKRKKYTKGQQLIAPGERQVQPTPSSRALFDVFNMFWDLNDDGTVKPIDNQAALENYSNDGLFAMANSRVSEKIIELPMDEWVDMYNNGVRWVAVDPELDAELMATETASSANDPKSGAVPTTAEPAEQIDDFGEKIGGARKDVYEKSIGEPLPEQYKDIKMSKHFPVPKFDDLIAAGANPRALALSKAMRDEIPNKPRQAYKLKRWGDQVTALKKISDGLIAADSPIYEISKIEGQLRESGGLSSILDRQQLYLDVGFPEITDLKGFEINKVFYSKFGDESDVTKYDLQPKGSARSFGGLRGVRHFDSYEAAVEALREALESDVGTGKAKTKLDLYSNRLTKKVYIGKKTGSRKYIDLRSFDSLAEARAYLAANNDELLEELERRKRIPSMRRETNLDRVGKDHRQGANVSPEQFGSTFGFRGVEFGNWVENDKRQENLNDAYDALMDLSGLIDVSPRALSLDGKLGLAFGARGKGGKGAFAAHYEPGKVVINLTKKNGAGSLAHEWWHALDNYFDKMREGDGYVSESPRQRRNRDGSLDERVRPEILAAWKHLMGEINATALPARAGRLDKRRTKNYWGTGREMTARAFERFVIDKAAQIDGSNDFLANIATKEYWDAEEALSKGMDYEGEAEETYPYPTETEAAAINPAYQALFDEMQERDTENGKALFALKAMHSTPHTFDRFDLAHVGSGEGAQAYGYGLYFTTSEKVAKWYRKAFKDRKGSLRNRWTVNGRTFTNGYDAVNGFLASSDFEVRDNNVSDDAFFDFTGHDSFTEYVGQLVHYEHQTPEDIVFDATQFIEDENLEQTLKANAEEDETALPWEGTGYTGAEWAQQLKDDFIIVRELAQAMEDAGFTYENFDTVNMTDLKNYFRPGRLVQSSVGWDEVVSFQEVGKYSWLVEVREVGGASPRTRAHSTPPDAAVVRQVLGDEYTGPKPSPVNTLEVEIEAELEHMMDWDKPLDKQTPYVQERLQMLDDEVVNTWFENGASQAVNGRQMYLHLDDRARRDGFHKEAWRMAANKLEDLGISGITYEGDSSGVRNYVVFNDDVVKILNSTAYYAQRMATEEQAQGGMTEADVRAAIGPALDGVSDAVGLKVEVVHSNNLPYEVTKDLKPGEVAKGAFLGDTIYLVSNTLDNARDAQVTFAHEVVGHFGVNRIVGDRFPELAAGYRQMKKLGGKQFDEIYDELVDRYGKNLEESTEISEFIAIAAEKRPTEGKVATYLRKVREFLNSALRAMGFKRPFSVTDINNILSFSERYLGTGEGAATTEVEADGPAFSLLGRKRRDRDSMTDAENAAVDHGGFGYQPRGQTYRQRFNASRENGKTRFRQYWVDQYDSIKSIVDNPRAWMKAQLAAGSWGFVEAGIEYGRLGLHQDGVITVDESQKGLKELLAPLGEDLDRFTYWIAGNRADKLLNEVDADGNPAPRERLFNQAQVNVLKGMNKNGKPGDPGYRPDRERVFDEVRQEFEAWGNAVTQIAVETGLVNAEEAAMWSEEGFYLPFYRVLDEDTDSPGPRVINNAKLVRQQAYKKLKGGEQQLDDLLGNAMMNWNHLLSASMKNQAARETLEAAESMGLATRTTAHAKSKDAVFVRVDGKEQWWDLSDDSEGQLVMQALGNMNYSGMKEYPFQLMRKAKRGMTIGVTASPEFKVANLIRDTMQAIAVTPMSVNMFKNVYAGWKATAEEGGIQAELLASGAIFAESGYIHGADPDAIRYAIRKGVERDTILDSRMAIKKVFDKYQDLGARGENVNRASVYMQARAAGADRLEAAFAARDLMDFSRSGGGVATRFLASTVPFLNARIQGLDKVARSAMDPNQRKRLGAVIGAYSAASIALYLLARGEDDWDEIEDWERDTYHMFKIDGTWYRIPRPFEVGAMATMSERLFEQMYDEISGADKVGAEVFAQRLGHMMLETFSFNPAPQLFMPVLEVWANHNLFLDRSIETLGQTISGVSTSERSNPGTSTTAIAVSKGMEGVIGQSALSPVQIDHLVQGYFGWLGASTVAGIDMLTAPVTGNVPKPERKITEYPVIKRFVKASPARSTKYTEAFYDYMADVNRAWADVSLYRRLGRHEEARALREENRDLLRNRRVVNSYSDRLSKINARMRRIYADPDMGSRAKRLRLDELQIQKNALVEKAMARVEN